MRFVVTAEWKENHLLRLILAAFLVYVLLLWVTNGLLFFANMSLSPSSVADYYRGAEEQYRQARSFKVMLEISHFHLFAMGILILTMTHLVLFVPVSVPAKGLLIVSSFVSALLDEGGGWLTRFVHPACAWVKIAGFVGLEASLAAMLVLVGWSVWRTPPNAYRGGNGGR